MDYLERRNLLAGLKSFKALGLLSSQWNEIIFTLSRINTTLERTEDELNLINPEPNSFLFMEEDHLVPTIAWPFIISGTGCPNKHGNSVTNSISSFYIIL